MKRFISFVLLGLLTASAYGSEVHCENAYKKRSETFKKYGLVSMYGWGVGIGAAAVPVLAPVSVAIGVGSYAGYIALNARSDRYEQALILFEESFLTREGAVDRLEKQYMDRIIKYYEYLLESNINPQREREGLPPMTLEELIKLRPIKKFDRENAITMTDHYLGKINQKLETKIDYDTVTRIINDSLSDDTFCKDGKALAPNKIVKFVRDSL